jgi:hypothetical protein
MLCKRCAEQYFSPSLTPDPGNPLFSRSERHLLAGLCVIVFASWGRFFATGSVKVDESYPRGVAEYALLGMLVAGWALAVTGWRRLVEEPPAQPRRLAFVALGVSSAMLPMLSNDVFSLFAYGATAAQGHDVYTTTAWLPSSPFHAWLGERWDATVCVYGPATLLATLPAGLAGGNPWLALLLLRVAWCVPLVLAMELSLRRFADRPAFHAMVWLNPLWLVEGPGQMHADLLGVIALVAGMALHVAGRVKTSFALYAAAVLGKYSFAPAGLWFLLAGEPRRAAQARRAAVMGVILVAAAVAVYAPFWRGIATVTTPLATLGKMNPGGSITEVVSILVQFVRSGSVTPPDMAVHSAVELDRATKQATWTAVSWVMRLVFAGVAARVFVDIFRKGADDRTVALGTGTLTVGLLTLASHRFQCWYLVAALPFFGLATTPAWRRWWLLAVAVCPTVDFACMLERSSPLYPVWGAVTTGAQIVVFVAWFRARYLRPAGDAGLRRDTRAPAEPSSLPADR